MFLLASRGPENPMYLSVVSATRPRGNLPVSPVMTAARVTGVLREGPRRGHMCMCVPSWARIQGTSARTLVGTRSHGVVPPQFMTYGPCASVAVSAPSVMNESWHHGTVESSDTKNPRDPAGKSRSTRDGPDGIMRESRGGMVQNRLCAYPHTGELGCVRYNPRPTLPSDAPHRIP